MCAYIRGCHDAWLCSLPQGAASDWLEADGLDGNPCLALWRRCRPAWWLEQHTSCKLPRYMPPP